MQNSNSQLTFWDVFLRRKGNEYFPGQAEGEKIEFFLIRHWIVLLPALITLFIFFVLLGWVTYYVMTQFWDVMNEIQVVSFLMIITGLLSIWLHILFIKLLNYFMHVVLVTNRRIIVLEYTALFHRRSDSIEFANIQDIIYLKIGFFKSMMNYGDLVVHNASGQEVFSLDHVPKPEKHFNIINHVYDKYKRDGGIPGGAIEK